MVRKNLTIVIPLYNQEKYIKQCLESILSQKNIDIFVIVVNDGSTDNSLTICEEIAAKDRRVKIVSQENHGLAAARFTGINHTTTKYVTFVDADDFILENAYDKAVEYMRQDVDMIFFEISRYYDEHRIKREYHILDEGIYNKKKIYEDVFYRLIWNFDKKTPGIECSQCVRIVKTSLLKKMYDNLNDNRFYYGEDIAITYPLITKIDTMAVISYSYYMHRQRPDNIIPEYIKCEHYFDEVLKLCNYLRCSLKELYTGYNFDSQIDYLYMYSVELKKMCYGDYYYNRDFLFPFNSVPAGKKIILYGAGETGKAYYNQITRLNYCSEILWIDKNAKNLSDNRVVGYEIFDNDIIKEIEYVVIAIEKKEICKQIKVFLQQKGIDENIIVY